MDLALPGSIDKLESHFDAERIGVVKDQLDVTLERAGFGIQSAGVGRIGDLFDTDDDLHERRWYAKT